MNEWISVKDKLPERGEPVLTRSTDSFYVAWIARFGKENRPIWEYSWCCGCHPGEEIKYWIPLPILSEPPK